METNPYEYDRSIPWTPQQNQFYQGSYIPARTSQQPFPVLQNQQREGRHPERSEGSYQRPPQRVVNQKPTSPQRISKAQALALARTLKKWLVIASLVSFGT